MVKGGALLDKVYQGYHYCNYSRNNFVYSRINNRTDSVKILPYVWTYTFFFSTILKKKVIPSEKNSQSYGITKWKKASGYPQVNQYILKQIKIGQFKELIYTFSGKN